MCALGPRLVPRRPDGAWARDGEAPDPPGGTGGIFPEVLFKVFPAPFPKPFPGLFPRPFPKLFPALFPKLFPAPFPKLFSKPFPGLFPRPFPKPFPGLFPRPFPGLFPKLFPKLFPAPFPKLFPGLFPKLFPGLFPAPFLGTPLDPCLGSGSPARARPEPKPAHRTSHGFCKPWIDHFPVWGVKGLFGLFVLGRSPFDRPCPNSLASDPRDQRSNWDQEKAIGQGPLRQQHHINYRAPRKIRILPPTSPAKLGL